MEHCSAAQEQREKGSRCRATRQWRSSISHGDAADAIHPHRLLGSGLIPPPALPSTHSRCVAAHTQHPQHHTRATPGGERSGSSSCVCLPDLLYSLS